MTTLFSRFRTWNQGFTLIELILYIALVSIFISGAIFFAWDLVYGRQKAFTKQTVNQSARIAMSRIAYEIRRTQAINSLTATSIELENGTNDTTISLNSDIIELTTDGTGPYDLTSDQVSVTDLSFTDLSSTDENSQDILVSLTLTQSSTATSEHFNADTTLTETIELNSQFNQSRRLLIDGPGAVLSSSNKQIEGVTLQNTDTTDLVIDQLTISWSGTGGGENITEVQINGDSVEWSGSQGSGSTLDLSDYTLTSAAGVVDLDYLEFDSSMSDAAINLIFILSDGSSNKLTLFLSGGADTCTSYCSSLNYSSGTCRQNADQCLENSETHESSGDQYCTGGPSVDTCCCDN